MRKGTAIICLCIGGCLIVGVVIASVFQVKPNQQPRDYSARELTEEEKEEVIRIALNDKKVKEKLKGKEYKVSGTDMPRLTIEKGEEKVLKADPGVHIYTGEDDWMKITRIHAIVDLDNKKVIRIDEYRWLKPIMPKGVTEEERKKAIKIALSNESLKEKLDGLGYKISLVHAIEKWMTGEKLYTDVYLHINGTTICYSVKINPEGKVTGISEVVCGGKIGEKKSRKASKIAQNDPRIKEKIEGKIKGKDYEVSRSGKLIDKRFVVDVYIDIKAPPERYVATVDTEEWKVIGVWKIARGFFERGEEIK